MVALASHLSAQTARTNLDGAKPFRLKVTSLGPRRRPVKEGDEEDEDLDKDDIWQGYAQRSREQFGRGGSEQEDEDAEEKQDKAEEDDDRVKEVEQTETRQKKSPPTTVVPRVIEK